MWNLIVLDRAGSHTDTHVDIGGSDSRIGHLHSDLARTRLWAFDVYHVQSTSAAGPCFE